jgi:hypothetical protein
VTSQLFCPQDERRRLVRDSTVNGVDYLEVLPSQRTLLVHCFRSTHGLDAGNVRIEGGERIRAKAVWAFPGDELHASHPQLLPSAELDLVPVDANVLAVRTDSNGDFSTYTLTLVESPARPDRPPPSFDELVSTVPFSFKVDCPSDFDCAPPEECPVPTPSAPQIDYLAKDYASFRRLMLDRLAVLVPDWEERSPADLLVALVEVLAYAGDSLSYFQDAAATEAYLGTARRRTSVRRHARLVDYVMHEGANARVWVCLDAGQGADGATLPERTMVLSAETGASARAGPEEVGRALSAGALVFETLHSAPLRAARNRIELYTWGDERCCLPKGATRATLLGSAADLDLHAGSVLVFEETLGPRSGRAVDADPAHRHAVRLSAEPVEREDPVFPGRLVLDVEWFPDDALPFPLCLWELVDDAGERRRASVARGNVVLADHGVQQPRPRGGAREEREQLGVPERGRRFRPELDFRGLTHALPYDDRTARKRSAAAALRLDLRSVKPWIRVFGEDEIWTPERELLNSDRFATSFVAEMEEDGRAFLRFGDGVLGRQPAVGAPFSTIYRIGNGAAGNVGPSSLCRVVTDLDVTAVTNPLPATGGTDPEPLEQVRLQAPQAFRSQRRAVTVDDYAAVAERHPEVQRAGATRRWTGSWYTVFVTVDRVGGREITREFEDELRAFMDPYRLAGYDLEIDAPRFVPLELAVTVCVRPGYVRSTVEQALLEALGSRDLPDGRRGFFHPDNFTFAQPVYLSPIVAAAMAVPGVDWVDVTAFHRWREAPGTTLADGRIGLGRLEIARLDNDPNRPERGRIELDMRGGL